MTLTSTAEQESEFDRELPGQPGALQRLDRRPAEHAARRRAEAQRPRPPGLAALGADPDQRLAAPASRRPGSTSASVVRIRSISRRAKRWLQVDGVVGLQHHPHPRILLGEALQHPRDVRVHDVLRHPERELALEGLVGHPPPGLVVQRQQPPGVAEQLLALRGQRDRPPRAVEQR